MGYYFVYSNKDIYRITVTDSIQNYIEKQNFTWLPHCSRMSNNMIQKQIMFIIPTRKHYRDYWVKLENRSGMDKCQLRTFDKKLFNSWVFNDIIIDKPNSSHRKHLHRVKLCMYVCTIPCITPITCLYVMCFVYTLRNHEKLGRTA